MTTSNSDPKRELLRHTVATFAPAAVRPSAMLNAPAELAEFRAGPSSRMWVQILAHLGDLLDWGLSVAQGKQIWEGSEPLPWEKEPDRFLAGLKSFDDNFASAAPWPAPAEKLLQGPIADALTHIGQLAMLRRMAGGPVKGHNYFVADVVAGRGGTGQTTPTIEFD